MPEVLEIELYRRAAEAVVDRRIDAVVWADDWCCRAVGSDAVRDLCAGARVTGLRRRGKLLMLDLDRGATLGLRFGMTGRLVVDGEAPIERLEYASGRDDPAWDRLVLSLSDGGRVRVNDPRRLGTVEIDPDLSSLGPDVLDLPLRALRAALTGSTTTLKARLLDQSHLAGIGNLLADEICWRAALDPARVCRELDDAEVRRLHRVMRSTLVVLLERGGSHTGDLMEARHPGGRCPRDGAELERRTIGGRTTYSCPVHQR